VLDLVDDLFCRLYNSASNHTFGVAIFNHNVKVVIPLAAYTPVQFLNQTQLLRDTKDSSTPLCCSCCTPMAEAFDLAGTEFTKNGTLPNH